MNRILFILMLLITSLLTPQTIFAWDDCPKGLTNDPYPGNCARYIDTDGNGICDHSEPAPEDRGGEAITGLVVNGDNEKETVSDKHQGDDAPAVKSTSMSLNTLDESSEEAPSGSQLNLVAMAVVGVPFLVLLTFALLNKIKS